MEHLEGVVSSQGFSSRNLILQYNPQNHQDCFTRNKRNFCFQIWPKLSYDARREYQEQVAFFEETFGEKEDEDNNDLEMQVASEANQSSDKGGDKDKEGAPVSEEGKEKSERS